MTTLATPRLDEFSPDDRAILDGLAKRTGQSADALIQPSVFGVQAHWPAWLQTNFQHSLSTYLRQGTLPPLAKEAMHVAVSMTNHCEY